MYITLEQILQLGILICSIINIILKAKNTGKRK